jgi:hypothetical protein
MRNTRPFFCGSSGTLATYPGADGAASDADFDFGGNNKVYQFSSPPDLPAIGVIPEPKRPSVDDSLSERTSIAMTFQLLAAVDDWVRVR